MEEKIPSYKKSNREEENSIKHKAAECLMLLKFSMRFLLCDVNLRKRKKSLNELFK
jgi:hypothetical protein